MAGIDITRRFYTDVSVVMYSLSHRGISRVKHIYKLIHSYFDVDESYVIYYGYPRPKTALPIQTYFLDPPYSRGKVFVVGAKLVQKPVILYVNLDSSCLSENLILDSVESVIDGSFQLYLTIPLTSTEFLEEYRASPYRVLEKHRLLEDLQHPSYSIVVGRRKLFLTADYTPWSVEQLVALDTSTKLIGVRNDGCTDVIPGEVVGFGKVLMNILTKKLTSKLVSKGMLREVRGVEQE